eukprot:14577488-Ditylum_brightwellii.AAC.1
MLLSSAAVNDVSIIGFNLQKSSVPVGVALCNGGAHKCGVSDSSTCDGDVCNMRVHICCAPDVAVQDNIVPSDSASGGSAYVGNMPGADVDICSVIGGSVPGPS